MVEEFESELGCDGEDLLDLVNLSDEELTSKLVSLLESAFGKIQQTLLFQHLSKMKIIRLRKAITQLKNGPIGH